MNASEPLAGDIEMMAHHLAVWRARTVDDAWDDFPLLSQTLWQRICARAELLILTVVPDPGPSWQGAYERLASACKYD